MIELSVNRDIDWIFIVSSLLLSPFIETLILLVVWVAVSFATKRQGLQLIISVLVYFSIGWVMHGASAASIGHATSFGLLATLFVFITRDRGARVGYFYTVLAHAIWNAGGFALAALFRANT